MYLWNPKELLTFSLLFDAFQSLVGAPKALDGFLSMHVKPSPGDSLLDLGCGVGATVRHIPRGVNYTGIDISEEYIQTARSRFGSRGTFIAANVADAAVKRSHFDCAIAVGVMHHLDDGTAHSLLDLAASALRPGGCLFTVDPCYHKGQSWIGRYITSKDRGQFVRTPGDYNRLFEAHGKVDSAIVRGFLRVPYTHVIAKIAFTPALDTRPAQHPRSAAHQ